MSKDSDNGSKQGIMCYFAKFKNERMYKAKLGFYADEWDVDKRPSPKDVVEMTATNETEICGEYVTHDILVITRKYITQF